jgi:hypothetical protein
MRDVLPPFPHTSSLRGDLNTGTDLPFFNLDTDYFFKANATKVTH